LTSKGEPYHRVRYKNIIEEQVILGYLTKGGVAYGDSENMTPYERKLALETMKKFLEASENATPETIVPNDPKTLLTKGTS
jgi:hypothetical protein